jgi:hypothetical protein
MRVRSKREWTGYQLPATSFRSTKLLEAGSRKPEAGSRQDGHLFATNFCMIEQPPKPDVPKAPDVVNKPTDVNRPVPTGEPEGDERPDIHPTPPPTDPAPPII